MIKTEIQEKKSLSHVSQKCYLNREWTLEVTCLDLVFVNIWGKKVTVITREIQRVF